MSTNDITCPYKAELMMTPDSRVVFTTYDGYVVAMGACCADCVLEVMDNYLPDLGMKDPCVVFKDANVIVVGNKRFSQRKGKQLIAKFWEQVAFCDNCHGGDIVAKLVG